MEELGRDFVDLKLLKFVETPDNIQVVTLFEAGMSCEEIAMDLGYEVSGVKLILARNSKKFKELNDDLKESGEKGLFTYEDAKEAARGIKELSENAQLETVSLRAKEFIINEFKGRNDINAITNQQFNITLINDALLRARDRIKSAKAKHELEDNSNIIQLPPSKVA